MPPRHAYWTILIDNKPTAFRAREQEELLPTFHQLQRKNTNAEMKWFARGRLWETQELEREDFQRRKRAAAGPYERSEGKPPAGAPGSDALRRRDSERRSGDWRPGGAHKDPRDRFKKKNRPDRMWSEGGGHARRDRDKPDVTPVSRPAEGERKPWRNKPSGPPRGDRPWSNKPAGGPPRGDRPWSNKPAGGPPRGDRPWSNKPAGGPPRGDRPWSNKPAGGPPRGDRPWSSKPVAGGKRPWTPKPPGGQPWRDRPRPDAKPLERRSAEGPSTRPKEPTPAPEQIRTKPKPPERG